MSGSEPPAAVDDRPLPAHPGGPGRPGGGGAQGALAWLGVAALVASAAVGGNLVGLRDRLWGSEARRPRAPAVSREADGPATTAVERPQTLVRSQPWWQEVATLEGQGPTRSRVTIDDAALQWRVRGSCPSGRLVVTVAGRPKPVLDAACAGGEAEPGYATRSGALDLEVAAEGRWRLEVEQQVDVPLEEPPLAAMSAPGTRVVATGDFYRMDQTGQGTVTVYRLADGSHALRLDRFFVTANVDLEITFSPLEAPRTTSEFMGAPWVRAAPLDITAGSLNFAVPPGVDPAGYRSVVIWCPLIDSAYAAATLVPASP